MFRLMLMVGILVYQGHRLRSTARRRSNGWRSVRSASTGQPTITLGSNKTLQEVDEITNYIRMYIVYMYAYRRVMILHVHGRQGMNTNTL